jgi:hypothetical protein
MARWGFLGTAWKPHKLNDPPATKIARKASLSSNENAFTKTASPASAGDFFAACLLNVSKLRLEVGNFQVLPERGRL